MITTIVLIRAEPASVPETAQRLAEIDGVTEVYSVSGDWDLVAIVRVPEYDQIARVVRSMISPCIAYELKSQYPHFEGQNGVCT